MKYVIFDERLPRECVNSLRKLGFNTLSLPPVSGVCSPISSHTDIVLFRYGRSIVLSHKYAEENPLTLARLRGCLTGFEFIFTDDVHGGEYPSDAIFNALVMKNRIFCKKSSISGAVISLAEKYGARIIDTKQGYPACTVLAIGQRHAITSDRGMAKKLISEDIDVLTVPETERILLKPYKNGFIGGCAGVFGDTVYFIGNLRAHPQSEDIQSFICDAGFRAVSLMPRAECLFDLGGLCFCEQHTEND